VLSKEKYCFEEIAVQFSPRVAILAQDMLSSYVCLSVRPSVCHKSEFYKYGQV